MSNFSEINKYQSSYLKLPNKQQDSLMTSIDYINKTYGANMIKLASQNIDDLSTSSRNKLSPKYMNSWEDIINITI